MMSKCKKIISLVLTVIVAVSLLPTSQSYALEQREVFSVESVMSMDGAELLETLLSQGLVLPEMYEKHPDTAQNFVEKYVPLLLEGTLDPTGKMFNFDQSNEMLSNVAVTLAGMGLPMSMRRSINEWTLQNSTAIGSWSDSFLQYNCYAYATGLSSQWLIPGGISGTYFDTHLTVSEMGDVVMADLAAAGYEAYKTAVKPTSLPDMWFKVICLRKDEDNQDFHVMKMGDSLSSWSHKPGDTQPLKWNYSSPSFFFWDNENVKCGVARSPDITYESNTCYIVYKHQNDPGVHPLALEEPHMLSE